MSSTSAREIVVEIAATLVASAAPDETMLFPAHARLYVKAPKKLERLAETSGEQMLGMGAGTVEVLISPILIAATAAVFQHLAVEVGKAIGKQASEALVKRLFKLFSGDDSGERPPELSGAQLASAREVAQQTAIDLGVDTTRAATIAAAVAGSLTQP